MIDLLEYGYENFKTDVFVCLAPSIAHYHLKYNSEASDIEDYEIVLENPFYALQLSLFDLFPHITVSYCLYNQRFRQREIPSKLLDEVLRISYKDRIRITKWTVYELSDTPIRRQLREINQVWMDLLGSLLTGKVIITAD